MVHVVDGATAVLARLWRLHVVVVAVLTFSLGAATGMLNGTLHDIPLALRQAVVYDILALECYLNAAIARFD